MSLKSQDKNQKSCLIYYSAMFKQNLKCCTWLTIVSLALFLIEIYKGSDLNYLIRAVSVWFFLR